jgi:hypothetical protein
MARLHYGEILMSPVRWLHVKRTAQREICSSSLYVPNEICTNSSDEIWNAMADISHQ